MPKRHVRLDDQRQKPKVKETKLKITPLSDLTREELVERWAGINRMSVDIESIDYASLIRPSGAAITPARVRNSMIVNTDEGAVFRLELDGNPIELTRDVIGGNRRSAQIGRDYGIGGYDTAESGFLQRAQEMTTPRPPEAQRARPPFPGWSNWYLSHTDEDGNRHEVRVHNTSGNTERRVIRRIP
ncbi:hypothetical protein CC53_gp119 [Rhizobium phage vB_RleS_L338C]|uniref:hypothetical protein n=1 Tax=Rhizobium phage vB_RleS_L338C TaxID=1414737 RepID=UPI0003D84742|nr:hypothetical protein CC53_gp119 [Rhizobium phage vB_RleS_L338C]AHC30536.1 hypothetical protein L338C_119 [Rhizobium phage vB_RleS_L338C]QNH72087.1 hypothetical protein P11VFA_031 [Rhizobium phage P11VFA]